MTKDVNERKIGKRRNPYWLSVRGINLGSVNQKPNIARILEEDDHEEAGK